MTSVGSPDEDDRFGMMMSPLYDRPCSLENSLNATPPKAAKPSSPKAIKLTTEAEKGPHPLGVPDDE